MKRKLCHAILLLFLTMMAVPCAWGQPFCQTRSFNVSDGLPSNSISRVVQGPDGLIWVATWNGLSSFDGYGFTSFRSGDRHGHLTSSRIVSLAPDNLGKVWLLNYDRKPYIFDPVVSRFQPLEEILTQKAGRSCKIQEIFPAGEHIWLVTDGAGPSMRVKADLPVDTASVELFGRDKLRGGASRINKVLVDSLGNEWIFTDAGVQLYGTPVACKGNFLDPVGTADATFLATADGRLYSFRKGDTALSPIAPPAAFGLSHAGSIKALDANNIILAVPGGLAVYDLLNRSWRLVNAGTAADPVADVFVDSRHRAWAFTKAGRVWLTDPAVTSAKAIEVTSDTPNASRSSIPLWVEDRFGTIWLAPKGGLFGFYDEEKGRINHREFMLSHLKYTSIPEIDRFFVDKQSNLWIGTTHDLTLVNFNHHIVKTSPLVLNDEVRSVLAIDGGKFLAGSRSGVLGRYNADGEPDGYISKTENADGTGRVTTSAAPVKFSTHLYSMFEDSDKDIWIGTKGDGLYLLHPDGSLEHFRHNPADPYSIPTDSVYDIAQDDKGNIWVGTFGGGLLKAEKRPGGKTKFIHAGNTLKNYPVAKFPRVRRITCDGKGAVILSTSGGLITFSSDFKSPADIEFFTSVHVPGDPASVSTADVMQTLVASNGEIYVATMGGELQMVDSDNLLQPQLKFKRSVGKNDQLSMLQNSSVGGNILSMIEDTSRNIYLVRETSILVYSPSTGAISLYGRNDIGGSIDFTEAAPQFSTETGKLVFGAMGGVVLLNPEEIVKSSYVPQIVFTGIQFQGEPEKQQMVNPSVIEVQGGKRNFAISFAALDYSNNGNIQYAYRLAEDPDWTYIGTARIAHFNHLEPGKHTLLVKSTDGNGMWLDNQRELSIIVHPDFWESNWAKLIYFVGFLIIAWLIAYLFTLNRKSYMTSQLRKKEKQFFMNASHQLRTPLTLIGAPVAEVLETEPLSDRARSYLEKVYRSARQMLDTVNGILTNASDHNYITDTEIPDMALPTGILAPDAPATATDSAETAEKPAFDAPAAQRAEPAAPADGNRVKILVVEDNDDLRSFLCDILSVQYDVIAAPNGAAGLEKAEKEQPDFIVTDVTMPEMDGLTMVKKIKQNKKLSHIPIIVLSARASVEDRVRGLNEGVDDYITKPFSATYLRQRISSIRAQRKILQQNFFEQIGQNFSSVTPEQIQMDAAPDVVAGSGATPADGAEQAAAGAPAEAQQPREWRLESPQITDADQEMMKKLLNFMEEHIADEDLKIEELAEAVHMGRTVFYGKIKALVGMSPSDFLRRLRMQRAEELIARSKMNFSQIAFRIGFSDPKYFTKCFKKETGMTPSEYRQQAQRQQLEND